VQRRSDPELSGRLWTSALRLYEPGTTERVSLKIYSRLAATVTQSWCPIAMDTASAIA
jgi:hypothetical protein